MGTSLSFHRRNHYCTRRLLLTLMVIASLLMQNCFSNPTMVQTSIIHQIRHSQGKTRHRDSPLHSIRRDVWLLKNRCSGRYMNIYNTEIAAKVTDPSEPTALMEFLHLKGNPEQIYIRRKESLSYLCFSRKGKLIVKKTEPYLEDRCKFRIIPSSDYTSDNQPETVSIESIANPNWRIGFRRSGEPLRGWHYKRKAEKCFQFEKYSESRTDSITTASLSRGLMDQLFGT